MQFFKNKNINTVLIAIIVTLVNILLTYTISNYTTEQNNSCSEECIQNSNIGEQQSEPLKDDTNSIAEGIEELSNEEVDQATIENAEPGFLDIKVNGQDSGTVEYSMNFWVTLDTENIDISSCEATHTNVDEPWDFNLNLDELLQNGKQGFGIIVSGKHIFEITCLGDDGKTYSDSAQVTFISESDQ